MQILDPATSIWESAKIISFVSDWCVRIKWVDWSYNKKEDITVPEVYRPEKKNWNIRKSHNLVCEETVSNKRRSTPLCYNARRLVRNDQIYFWEPECNCVDSERCQEDRCCRSVVMGLVKINDPFCQQCLKTDVEDNDEYVSYRQLRNKPCVTEQNQNLMKLNKMKNQDLTYNAHSSKSKRVWQAPHNRCHKSTFFSCFPMLTMTLN